MSDDKLKHKPQTKHTLSEVLKSLQDLIRNDLVPTKSEPSTPSPVRQKPAASPPPQEPDSLNEALERLDNTITHNIIEPVERARETPPEPLLPDEEIEIQWEDESASSTSQAETIEAAAAPDETIELPPLEPEAPAVEKKSADADDSAATEIEVELAPPPEPAPEPAAHSEHVIEPLSVSESAESQTAKVSAEQKELAFAEPRTQEESPTLDLTAVDGASLEELTLALEVEGSSTPTETSELSVSTSALELEPERPHEAPRTTADAKPHAPPPPAADKKPASPTNDSNVIEWESPSLAKPTTPKTPAAKTPDADKLAAAPPVKPATPATTNTFAPKSEKAPTSAAPPPTARPASPTAATSPNKAVPPEPPKRPVEPARTAPPTAKPATPPAVPKPAATKPLSPVERAIKQAAPVKPTVSRLGEEPARSASAPSKATAAPLSTTKPSSTPAAQKPAPAAKPPDATKPAAAKPPAPKPAVPEQTEIPVLKEIAELATTFAAGPLPEPAQAREIAIRVIARLNIERRKAGETPFDIKTIERLQQYLAEALAKRALNQPK